MGNPGRLNESHNSMKMNIDDDRMKMIEMVVVASEIHMLTIPVFRIVLLITCSIRRIMNDDNENVLVIGSDTKF